MANYYIADMHLNHENVIRFDGRPFENVLEMNRALMDNWNEKVTGADTVYILGDMVWGKEEDWTHMLTQLRGKKVLITGNHDLKQFPAETKKLFLSIRDYADISDSGKRVILCHYAIPFHVRDYSDKCYMLYGHVHNTREFTLLEKYRKEIKDTATGTGHARGNFINVGCMMPWMDYTPRTLNEIIDGDEKWHRENPGFPDISEEK